ncbi:MAG: serine/threonine-protein kinase [Fimbriiglobus sp.]
MTEEALFELALNTPEAQRLALLQEHCLGNPALQARVLALLNADAQTAGFVPSPKSLDLQNTRTHHEPVGAAGQVVAGKYKLLDNIGEGGMGSVWRAQQTVPIKRLVAIKLIKAGMDSKGVLARFEAERQALAVMDHPNIAKILDGGLHENRPFFVMELVKGVPITTFCDIRKLNPRERLGLFLPVCGAIQHAHMKGIIHRDIKPSNVIVALYDDKPIPKVIDFGIAKATGGSLTDASYMTAFGGVVGTPQYMSPEQASLNNLDIDTRSDVYSLGVLLYELLAGSPPFAREDLEKAGLLEILRVVREEDPPRPSAKLSTAGGLPLLSGNRGMDPDKLTGLLRRELDWIVMKSLEKQRERRYESANSFAQDIERYLSGEAVEAVPPSLSYRMRKFIRKNKSFVIAASTVTGVLTIGIAGTTYGLIRAEQEAERANEEAANATTARNEAEMTLIRSIFRPIGYNTSTIDTAEHFAFVELSSQPQDRIKLLCLEQALQDGELALRVARRSEYFMQAVVGTSAKRRQEALVICRKAQADTQADPRIRLCATWLAAELGEVDIPSLHRHFETLKKQKKLWDWENFVDRLPRLIRPDQEVELWESLIGWLGNAIIPTYDNSRDGMQTALIEMAHRAEPEMARAATKKLLARLQQTPPKEYSNRAIGRCLDVMKASVDPDPQAFSRFVGMVSSSTNEETSTAARYGMEALAPKLDVTESQKVFTTLVGILNTTTNKHSVWAIADCLNTLAPRLNAAASRVQFEELLKVLAKPINGESSDAAVSVLISLAPNLDSGYATGQFESLLNEFVGSAQNENLIAKARVLPALTSKLPPDLAQKSFETLVLHVSKQTTYDPAFAAGNVIVALIAKLDSSKAAVHFDLLLDNIRKSTFQNANILSDALARLAPKTDEKRAKLAFDVLFASMTMQDKNTRTNETSEAILAMVPRLSASDSQLVYDELFTRFANHSSVETTHRYVYNELSYIMVAFLPRIDATKYFTKYLEILKKTPDRDAVRIAKLHLELLAPLLPPEIAQQQFDELSDGVNKSRTDGWERDTVGAITALSLRFDDEKTLDGLVSLLSKTTSSDELNSIGQNIVRIAPKLDSASAQKRYEVLADIFRKDPNWYAQLAVAPGLRALAYRLEAKQCEAYWSRLDHSEELEVYWPQYMALAPCLPAQNRSRLCQELITKYFKSFRLSTSGTLNEENFAAILHHCDSVPFIVNLLKQPDAVGDNRKIILRRLEELVFPDAIYDKFHKTEEQHMVIGGIALHPGVTQGRWLKPKFRTTHDAAQWIAAHHPELDLQRPFEEQPLP